MGRQPRALGPRRNLGGRRHRDFSIFPADGRTYSDSRDNPLKMVVSVSADLSGYRGFLIGSGIWRETTTVSTISKVRPGNVLMTKQLI